MNATLKATDSLNYNHPNFSIFLNSLSLENKEADKRLLAVELYEKIRDHFLYDPYHLDLRLEALKASQIVLKKRAWCVEKAIVLAAALRKFDIPSRLGYGIVVNHIGVEKLHHYLKRPEIVFHGYVEVCLNGNWTKATPAFDKRVCKLSGVPPLDWNGTEDSLFQSFSGDKKFMEYTRFYGDFDDVPIQLMNREMKKYYPHLFDVSYNSKEFSFYHENS